MLQRCLPCGTLAQPTPSGTCITCLALLSTARWTQRCRAAAPVPAQKPTSRQHALLAAGHAAASAGPPAPLLYKAGRPPYPLLR